MNEQLPGFVLAELFSKSVVNIDDDLNRKPVIEEHPVKKNWYFGNYERKIIVLVNDENNIYLSDESLNFLTGMLNACKLNLAHIALVNFKNNAVSFLQLKKDMRPEFLLLFGISALQIELPFTMPHYQVQQYSGCQILTAPGLTELNQPAQEAKAEKMKLWKSLQKMFTLEK